jgi:hypothetical protein
MATIPRRNWRECSELTTRHCSASWRGLISLGVCEESADARFSLTPVGAYLRIDHPESMQPRLLLNGEVHYALWNEVLETVRTGESASQRLFGMPFYDYLASTPAVGPLFDRTMASAVRYRHRPAVDAYDFGQFRTLVDVGGGNGTLMGEIMTAYPHRPVSCSTSPASPKAPGRPWKPLV